MNIETNVKYRWSLLYMLRLIIMTVFPVLVIALGCYFLVEYFYETMVGAGLSDFILRFFKEAHYLWLVLMAWIFYVLYKCIVSVSIQDNAIIIRRLLLKVIDENLNDVDVRIVSTKMSYTNRYHGQRFFKTFITPQSVKAIILYNNGNRKRINITGLGRNNAESLGEQLSWHSVSENMHSNKPMQ